MATAFSSAGSRTSRRAVDAVESWSADPVTLEVLEAIGGILKANPVQLIRLDRLTGSVAVAGRAEGTGLPRAVQEALVSRQGGAFVGREPCWLHDEASARHSLLLVRIVESHEQGFFLMARLPDALGARGRTTRLLPDLANLLGTHIEERARWRSLAEERDAAAQALDHGECGVIVIRSDHSIILANAAARATLSAETGLRIRRGAVHPTSYADAVRFNEAIDRVVDSFPGRRAAPPRALAMLLSETLDERPSIVVIAPAEPGPPAGSAAGPASGAAAVIYVIRPLLGSQRGLEALCQLHGLSRVETRLMIQLSSGLTVGEAAIEMRIKIDTARSYLKQIFGKMGVHRQTDLVGLMTRYQRALRGDFEFAAA